MNESRCDLLIFNGLERKSKEIDSSLYYADFSIYEVVRIIERKAIFLGDHLDRLQNSIGASSKNMLLKKEDIAEAVNKLINKVSVREGNIKISFNYTTSGDYSLIHFIDALYPDKSLYKSGVDTILFDAIRAVPDVKIYNYLLRSQIYDKLVRTGAYEAFLVNSDKCITEGSKSNVFFILNNKIVTAPDGTVLPGITRKYVIELCKSHGIDLETRCLGLDELSNVDSVFITGTSPKVLPVRSLLDHVFDVQNKYLRSLMSGYDDLLNDHILRESV